MNFHIFACFLYVWFTLLGSVFCCVSNSILKADVLLNAVKQTALDFARDRNLKKLSFNEEQIHKFEKSVNAVV